MHYFFLGFHLDSDKKALSFQSNSINLTKQNFQLLYYFVQNPNKVLNKDQLIEHVWNGRVVADNSVDQSIYKLKKILTSVHNDSYFETVYGLGVRFIPEVEHKNTAEKKQNKQQKKVVNLWWLVPLSLVVAGVIYLQFNRNPKPMPALSTNLLMVIPSQGMNPSSEWLNSSSGLFIQNLLKLSPKISLKNYSDKPNNLNHQQFLETQWQLSPKLKVLSSEISLDKDDFTLTLSIEDKSGYIKNKKITNKNLSQVYSNALSWLGRELSIDSSALENSGVFPQKPYLLELYLRGLAAFAAHKVDEARNYFELCLENDSDYHLATLEITKILDLKGESTKALALLDTVLAVNKLAEITIEASNQKGGILLRQGKPEEAKALYLSLLKDFKGKKYRALVDTKYKLALLYRTLEQTQKALDEFTQLELVLNETADYQTLADLYQAKASILLTLGETQKAKTYVQKSMELFVKLGALLGQARTHSLMARIAKQNANYSEAITHLNQALNIARGLNNAFGTGATLNEIIEVLITQGKINAAWKLNQEMETIAIEIDFTAMLLASKRYTVIIAEIRKQWKKADIYLKEHKQIAQAADNRIALIENQFMAISLKLKQGQLDDANNYLTQMDEYMYETNKKGIRVHFNVLKSDFLMQSGKTKKALALLNSSKILAKANEDNQAFTQINNSLAQIYLQENQPTQALNVLKESALYQPPALPYLLLQSKAHKQLGQISKAINLANQCKRNAYALWTRAEEQYLASLLQIKNSQK